MALFDDLSSFGAASKQLASNEDVKQLGFMAVLYGAIALLMGQGQTGAKIRDAVDDILTGAFGPIVGEILGPVASLVGLKQGAGIMSAAGVALGAFSGIGNTLAAYILPESVLADDDPITQHILMRTALIMVAVAAAITLALPNVRELVGGLLSERDISVGTSDKVVGAFLKGAIAYIVIGIVYCFYVRLSSADADDDGLCTEAEYDAVFANPANYMGLIFGPINTVVKLFVNFAIPFDIVPEN